jgi:hypothetical protein
MDPFKRKVLDLVVSRMRTVYTVSDLMVETVPMGDEGILLRVRETRKPGGDSPPLRKFHVQITEVTA